MAPEQSARIFAVGVNHKSGSAFLRDRLFIDEDMQPGIYAHLKEKRRPGGDLVDLRPGRVSGRIAGARTSH